MKDYIYPLHNATVDMASGQERSDRLCSPNVQQALFLQHSKNKTAVLWADWQNPNKHAWCQSSGNKPPNMERVCGDVSTEALGYTSHFKCRRM